VGSGSAVREQRNTARAVQRHILHIITKCNMYDIHHPAQINVTHTEDNGGGPFCRVYKVHVAIAVAAVVVVVT
jgi:hypothetical protein